MCSERRCLSSTGPQPASAGLGNRLRRCPPEEHISHGFQTFHKELSRGICYNEPIRQKGEEKVAN